MTRIGLWPASRCWVSPRWLGVFWLHPEVPAELPLFNLSSGTPRHGATHFHLPQPPHRTQNFQVQTPADARAGAPVGGGTLALPHALQLRAGATPHLVATGAGRLRQPLPAGSRAEGPA